MKYYVYMVRCADKTLYTGSTNNIKKRIDVHNKGKGAKYTRTRLPVVLVYIEEFDNISQALKREYTIKQMKKTKKEDLINSNKLAPSSNG